VTPPAHEPHPLRGIFLALGCAACAAGTIVIGKVGVSQGPPVVFALLLFTFGTPFSALLSLGLRQWRRPDRRSLLYAVLHGALSFVAVWCFWEGVSRIESALASFLNRAETLVAVAMGIVFLGERFRRLEVVGAALAVAGIVVMCLPQDLGAPDPLRRAGVALMLVGATVFGIAELLSKKAALRNRLGPFLVARNATMAACFGLAVLATGTWEPPPREMVAGACAAAILAPTSARLLFLLSLRDIDLAKSAILNQTQPLIAGLLAVAFLHERLTLREWSGGAVLLLGCVLLAAGARGRRGGSAPAAVLDPTA